MAFRDSLDKIFGVYLATLSKHPFVYRDVEYVPRDFQISPLIFRGFTCPTQCGGCCPRFSLDYLPSENHPENLHRRYVSVNGREFAVLSDLQNDHVAHHCRNLESQSGRCEIYEQRPFSCDFELIRFILRRDRPYVTQKLYGRGWIMLRVDGQRGARCEMTTPNAFSVNEVVRKFERLDQWARYFHIETWISEILIWLREGPHLFSLSISQLQGLAPIQHVAPLDPKRK